MSKLIKIMIILGIIQIIAVVGIFFVPEFKWLSIEFFLMVGMTAYSWTIIYSDIIGERGNNIIGDNNTNCFQSVRINGDLDVDNGKIIQSIGYKKGN